MTEKNYYFRKKAAKIHPQNIFHPERPITDKEIEIDGEYKIYLPEDSGIVLKNAAEDLSSYFKSAFGLKIRITKKYDDKAKKNIIFSLTASEEKYIAVKVRKSGTVVLEGTDERLAARAAYLAEKMMTARKAPYLEIRNEKRTPLFSPRMVHSGIGLDYYPDEYLRAVAHEGIDAVIVFVKGPDEAQNGYLDFNDLCKRAASYGIDVYAYSYMKSRLHPSDKGAYKFYDSLYGELFRKCPLFKGIIFVGESCEFPSKDPNTTGEVRDGRDPWGQDKPFPGWWPCCDFPQWIDIVKKVIRKEKPDCDFVFWSYNWGWAPKKDRLALINSLPTDISLLVTFEMFENVDRGGHTARTVDYSLFFEGPGQYFLSEAEAAKKRGIPLYAMTNTAGLTWDCGTVPFEPFPDQWVKRFNKIRECAEKYNLCGLMESHHFGFTPSIISSLADEYFSVGNCKKRGRRYAYNTVFGEKFAERGKEILKKASEGVRYLISTEHDQYGPMRVGPAFPMILERDTDFVFLSAPGVYHGGNEITDPTYDYEKTSYGTPADPEGELRCFKKASKNILDSALLLYELSGKVKEEFEKGKITELTEVLEYIGRSALTAVNVKRFKALKMRFLKADKYERAALAPEMKKIALEEIENSKALLPALERNSRLGYEPTMEYIGDKKHVEIKIKQVKKMIERELDPIIKN